MLRVRPTLYTPHVTAWAELLTALGLKEMSPLPAAISSAGAQQRCFAADSGRILLQHATEFGTELFLEVRDLEKFASWTSGDGTPVDLHPGESNNGTPASGRITAPDGLTFTALAVDSADTAGTPQDPSASAGIPAGQQAVLALWYTPDVPGVEATLSNIGAKPDTISQSGAWAQYRAKHGGYIAAHSGDEPRIELSLEYAGNLEALETLVAAAGIVSSLVDESYGRTLLVGHPDGGQLWVNERQLDLYGYARH